MLDHVNTESTKYEPYRESRTARGMKNKGVRGFPRDVSDNYVKLKASTPDRSGGEEVDRGGVLDEEVWESEQLHGGGDRPGGVD